MMTVNGMKTKACQSRQEAEEAAERWQGKRYRSGLLKHKDFGDHVEVKRDREKEKKWDEQWDRAQRGEPQRYVTYKTKY